MMKKTALLLTFVPLLMGAALASCEMDAYDKGEGEYSLTTADLVEARVGSDKRVVSVETDQGEVLTMKSQLTAKWIQTPDTTYRAMLYYNKLGDGQAEAVSFSRVGVLSPRDSLKGGLRTDPLFLESAWVGKNRKYLNLRLRVLTGTADNDSAQQSIGLLRDSIASTPRHARMTLHHDQGDQPEYYSATTFASVPLAEVPADTLTLTIATYEGTVGRTFVLK